MSTQEQHMRYAWWNPGDAEMVPLMAAPGGLVAGEFPVRMDGERRIAKLSKRRKEELLENYVLLVVLCIALPYTVITR